LFLVSSPSKKGQLVQSTLLGKNYETVPNAMTTLFFKECIFPTDYKSNQHHLKTHTRTLFFVACTFLLFYLKVKDLKSRNNAESFSHFFHNSQASARVAVTISLAPLGSFPSSFLPPELVQSNSLAVDNQRLSVE